jgi:hypothetical protein
MIDLQAIQEAAKTATTGPGTKLLEGGIGGAIMVSILRVAEVAIQKWRPRKNGKNGNAAEKPGVGKECIAQGNRLTALEVEKEIASELLKEVRDDVKLILGRLSKA